MDTHKKCMRRNLGCCKDKGRQWLQVHRYLKEAMALVKDIVVTKCCHELKAQCIKSIQVRGKVTLNRSGDGKSPDIGCMDQGGGTLREGHGYIKRDWRHRIGIGNREEEIPEVKYAIDERDETL